jgi:DNA invertase Pin-like site-specific DNA recombinase
MAKYGYARCSSLSQNTDIQVAALGEAGCTVIRSEKKSGRSTEGRTELATIIEFLQAGDVLCVHKLDRLGRNTRDVLNLVHELDERGCSLQVLEPAIDTGGPMGKVMLTVLGMVSEMELGFIKERQRAGIEKAKAEGKYKGRPTSLDHDKIRAMKAEGMGATAIAREMNCTRGAIYKVLKA